MTPWVTFDDLDTWLIIYNQVVVADSKSDISFAVNNDPEAQDSCKIRIIMDEMSYENDPWHS